MKVKNGKWVKCPLDGTPEWCPMVEIPTPHGRLIDVDSLLKESDIARECSECKNLHDEDSHHGYIYSLCDICDWVDGSPTVIEEEL